MSERQFHAVEPVTSAETYGRLKEGAHVAGYTFERACTHLEWLLEDDRWMLGGQYGDVNDFLASIKLDVDQLRIVAEQRSRIARRIKQLQPAASQRAIANAIGATRSSVQRDLAQMGQTDEENSNEINKVSAPCGPNGPPTANLDGATASRLIDELSTKNERREELRQDQEGKIAATRARETAPFDGIYDVVVIDPPWPMEKIEREVAPNQMAFEYPTMSLDEIAALQIPAADDCHLWLWTTQKYLPAAFDLLAFWQFRYVCTFVWHKPGGFQPFGLPQYNSEFVLYARRGSPVFTSVKALPTCFQAGRGAHSEKPAAFYDMVRRVTAGRRLDMFNRRAIDGFAGWGKEAA